MMASLRDVVSFYNNINKKRTLFLEPTQNTRKWVSLCETEGVFFMSYMIWRCDLYIVYAYKYNKWKRKKEEEEVINVMWHMIWSVTFNYRVSLTCSHHLKLFFYLFFITS